MSLTRALVLSAVAGEWGGVLADADVTATDTAGNLKEPLDRAFRAMAVAEADLATATVATGDESKAIAYASYFVLLKAWQALSASFNVGSAGAKADLHQQWENVKELLAHALAVANSYGLSIPTDGDAGENPVAFVGGITEGDWGIASAGKTPPLFSVDDLYLMPTLPSDLL